jgi:hypothetical protein
MVSFVVNIYTGIKFIIFVSCMFTWMRIVFPSIAIFYFWHSLCVLFTTLESLDDGFRDMRKKENFNASISEGKT